MSSLPSSLSLSLFFFNTKSSHFNLSLPFFLLTSGWESFIFMHGTLSYILDICHNRFNPIVLIIFIMLNSFYKLFSTSLFFVLHTPLTQIGPQIFIKISLSDMLNFPSSEIDYYL
jgi:hypothetical protein